MIAHQAALYDKDNRTLLTAFGTTEEAAYDALDRMGLEFGCDHLPLLSVFTGVKGTVLKTFLTHGRYVVIVRITIHEE